MSTQVMDEILAGLAIRPAGIAAAFGVSPQTVWRWYQNGVRGPDGTKVRLEAVKTGRNLTTSKPALERFFKALGGHSTIPEATPASPPSTPPAKVTKDERALARRLQELSATERALDDMGV